MLKVNPKPPKHAAYVPTEGIASERLRDPDEVAGRDKISIGKSSWGSLKMLRESLVG
jgi:hypothetical protein